MNSEHQMTTQPEPKLGSVQELHTLWTYSLSGEMVSYTDVTGATVVHQRDAFGRVIEVNDPAMTATFTFDELGRQVQQLSKIKNETDSMKTSIVYDSFGREIEREITDNTGETLMLKQSWTKDDQLSEKITFVNGEVVRKETYIYDLRKRLQTYICEGDNEIVDGYGQSIARQSYTHDALNNIVKLVTELKNGEKDEANFYFENSEDPTQLTRITHTHASYPGQIVLRYDVEGRMIEDEAGRRLSYDVFGRLIRCELDANRIGTYHYDAHNRLICQVMPDDGSKHYLYYRGDELVNELTVTA